MALNKLDYHLLRALEALLNMAGSSQHLPDYIKAAASSLALNLHTWLESQPVK